MNLEKFEWVSGPIEDVIEEMTTLGEIICKPRCHSKGPCRVFCENYCDVEQSDT